MKTKIMGIMLKTYLSILGVIAATVYVLNNFAPSVKGAILV
jgi:hypothetical protein